MLMNKIIPLHSLVIGVGASNKNREDLLSKHFDSYEILSAREVSYDLVGQRDRLDINTIVFTEIRRRAITKLELGERVVIDAANLRKEDRVSLAKIGDEMGVPVFYFLCDPSGADVQSRQRFDAAERDILRGDGIAEVIDWRIHTPYPISKHQRTVDEIFTRWSGITIIADVHGMYQSLLSALGWARDRNHYVIFLGDVVDYGRDTLEVADEVYRVISRGQGEMIIGNHERKISRWIAQTDKGRSSGSVRLSDGNRVTTEALNQLSPIARRRWQGRFKGLINHAVTHRDLGNIVLAHAAVHSGFWSGTASPREIDSIAMFGEFDSTYDSGSSRRYGWIDSIPGDKTVIVGHDIRASNSPFRVVNSVGGEAIFLDTGSGKGGQLSSVDLKQKSNGLKIVNFNMY